MSYFVYIIECTNGAYYTGYTTDVERRYEEHVQGTPKCKYTRSFPPKQLLGYIECATKSKAMKLEASIKKMSKEQKKMILASG